MRYYFAPMEGITGYIYRNAHREFFGGVDKYFTPFITPNQSKKLTSRELNDVLPEHNAGVLLVPQIMTSNAEHFIWAADKLSQLGYGEVNLNLGCPSRTVVAKGRGSGFLREPDQLNEFFDQVFSAVRIGISVKTRIGVNTEDVLPQLMEIFNSYPFTEVIIHPRLQRDYYKGTPDIAAFRSALDISKNPVVYNGNLFSEQSCGDFAASFGDVGAVMLGRGLIANPGLPGRIRTGADFDSRTLKAFHDSLVAGYMDVLRDKTITLFKLKEVWSYMITLFPGSEKPFKKICKASQLDDYTDCVNALFDCCEIDAHAVYEGDLEL